MDRGGEELENSVLSATGRANPESSSMAPQRLWWIPFYYQKEKTDSILS